VKTNSVNARSARKINLIGEYTDYNDAYVLPAAIVKASYVVITPGSDRQIRL
jgi:galactokinase